MASEPSASPSGAAAAALPLGRCPKGWRGLVSAFTPTESLSIPWDEMERRLLEMGFVEGAQIELLHDGPISRDPIAVRVDQTTVALRRRDAGVILVTPIE